MYHEVLPLGHRSLEETFPIVAPTCSYREYLLLLRSLDDDMEALALEALPPMELISWLCSLFLKHLWCVPTPPDRDDVSLYDHLKTTAAITSCLYAYHRDNSDASLDAGSKAFCLVGGDISGIQTYIFDVLNQQGKVAKRLRSRSLYVQLISDVAVHKILHAMNLPICNLITSAGGNFYVIAPNIENTDKQMNRLQKEFDEWAISYLGAELSLSLSMVEASGQELGAVTQTIDILKTRLNKQKAQAYRSALVDSDGWIESEYVLPEVVEGDSKICAGCHKHPAKPIEPNPDNLCEHCLNDVSIGGKLHKKRYIAFFYEITEGYPVLDYSFDLWDEQELETPHPKLPYLVLSLNKSEMKSPTTGFKYCVTHIPTRADNSSDGRIDGDPLTFEEIAELAQGEKLLGYVKGDVDNLGRLLREGLDRDSQGVSISRLSAFSRLLETFFSGYVQRKVETAFDHIYTVFSGGDDFFVVGPWNRAVEFARQIRSDFTRFCAYNPNLSFSCGVVLSHPYVPISYCADRAEAALDSSKTSEGKDRITLFETALGWQELDRVLTEAGKWIDWLTADPSVLSRSLVYNFRQYGKMAKRSGILGTSLLVDTKSLKFLPLLSYDIKRNLTKEDQKAAYSWAIDLRPTRENPRGGPNLPYLETIMDYVLTFTRSSR